MRKRKWFIMSILLAAVSAIALSSAGMAYGGGDTNATVNVEVSDINVSINDEKSGTSNPYLGAIVHVSGTVTVSAEANAHGILSFAHAMVVAGFSLETPSGIIDSDTVTDEDTDFGFLMASAEAGEIVLSWHKIFVLDQLGVYVFEQYGEGSAFASRFLVVRYANEAESVIRELTCHPRPWHETQFMFILRYGFTRLYDMDSAGILGEEIDSAGRFGDDTYFKEMDQYMIVVEEGTQILRIDGVRPICLYVDVIDEDGTPHATHFMPVLFSRPYTVYKMEGYLVRPRNTFTREWWEGDGEWVPVYTGTVID